MGEAHTGFLFGKIVYLTPRITMTFYQIKEILKRIAATVVMKVSGLLAIGSIADVDPIKNALMAAGIGVLEVVEELAKAYKEDGVLTDDEINSAFSSEESA